jgi:hypothetical protein
MINRWILAALVIAAIMMAVHALRDVEWCPAGTRLTPIAAGKLGVMCL